MFFKFHFSFRKLIQSILEIKNNKNISTIENKSVWNEGFLCIHLFHDYLSIIAHTLCKIPWFSACIQVDNNWHTFSDSNCCIFHEKEYYDLLEFIVSHIILAHFVNMFRIYMYFAFDITTKSIKIILYTPFNPNA